GVTFKPQVFFSKPVDPASLNATNFFVSYSGQPVPARIVPANDGRFAWLFVQGPMPAAARLTLTVDGSTIRAAAGETLDADGDGLPGGRLETTFTTVSLMPLPGTALSGILADPGPDNLPHTADDSDPGPDGVFMTADDVLLLPIPGVKVFVIGL